jgi:drug/metabolite transporter (DMT)-like permease
VKVLTPVIFILTTVLANLAMKKGVGLLPELALEIGQLPALLISLSTNVYLISGMVSYAVALVSYLLMLRQLELNLATVIASLNFVAVTLASSLILHERIPPVRWVGFAVIALGIYIVSQTLNR